MQPMLEAPALYEPYQTILLHEVLLLFSSEHGNRKWMKVQVDLYDKEY